MLRPRIVQVRSSDRASILYQIGDVLTQQRSDRRRNPVLQRCVAIDPAFASCWEGLGEASGSLVRTIKAKGFFNKAIGLFQECSILIRHDWAAIVSSCD